MAEYNREQGRGASKKQREAEQGRKSLISTTDNNSRRVDSAHPRYFLAGRASWTKSAKRSPCEKRASAHKTYLSPVSCLILWRTVSRA